MRSIFGKDQKKNQAKFLNTYYWFPGVFWTIIALAILFGTVSIGDYDWAYFVFMMVLWLVYAVPHYFVY